MSTSELQSVGLILSAEPGTDILVLDSNFSVVERGTRRLEVSLPPGLYKVKFQAGSAVHEEHVALQPDSPPVQITQPPLEFASTAPLRGTALSHEYQGDSAARTSREVHVHDGVGSRLFVFARTWTSPTRSDRSAALPHGQHPATGLSVHDLHGRLVADVVQGGVSDLQVSDAWSACSIDVQPGPYLLQLEVPEVGTLSQMVIAPPGWQAQVFLLQHNFGSTNQPVYRADLSTASMLLARVQEGFDPHSDVLRLTELAHTALTRQRPIVARDLLDRLLDMKFENPMLGLYAAHALLSAPEPDRAFLQIVVQRLRELLGNHPDVDALGLYLEQPVARTYETPPMLRRSWQIVVDRSARNRSLVPPGSMASRIAGAIWGDSVWLIWDAAAAGDSADDQITSSRDSVLKIEDAAERVASSKAILANIDLDDVEQALLSYATRGPKSRATRARRSRASAAKPSGAELAAPDLPTLSGDDPENLDQQTSRMAEALNLPPSTVQRTADRLIRKLDRA